MSGAGMRKTEWSDQGKQGKEDIKGSEVNPWILMSENRPRCSLVGYRKEEKRGK